MAHQDREKWDQRYRAGDYGQGDPTWMRELADEIPSEGSALDVAAGAGRIAIWLARRGLSVTAVDISPVGLALAREAASDEGVTIKTVAMDLEREVLPEGPFQLITCFHYRQRALFPILASQLAPEGVIVAELLTVKNLEKQARPSRRWLSEPNELLRDCPALEVLFYRETWIDGRHLARLVAKRPLAA